MTQNPYDPQAVARGKAFVDRTELRTEIVDWMTYGHQGPYYIAGGRRSGKTSFLYAVDDALQEADGADARMRTYPLVVSLYNYTPRSEEAFYLSCLQALDESLQIPARSTYAQLFLTGREKNPKGGPLDDFQRAIRSVYENSLRNRGYDRLVLLIDEFDRMWQLDDAELEDFFGHMRTLLLGGQVSRYVGLVMIGSYRPLVDKEQELSPLRFITNIRLLRVLDEEDAKTLLVEPRHGTVHESRFVDEQIEELIRITGGHPYLIQTIMSQLCGAEKDPVTEAEIERSVAALDGIFAEWDTRLDRVSRRIYATLANSSDGLTAEDLLREVPEAIDARYVTGKTEMLISMGVLIDVDSPVPDERRYRVIGTAFRDWFVKRYPTMGTRPTYDRGRLRAEFGGR